MENAAKHNSTVARLMCQCRGIQAALDHNTIVTLNAAIVIFQNPWAR
jgi:hypothetical protein